MRMRKKCAAWLCLLVVMAASMLGPMKADAAGSYENQEVYSFVQRMYEKVLGRGGDPEGIDGWYQQLVSGQNTGAQIVYGFVFSEEFIKKSYGDADFVHILYRALFDREADATGFAAWTGKLSGGESRLSVCKGFVDSQEFSNLCSRFGIIKGTIEIPGQEQPTQPESLITQFVKRLYVKALGRDADEAGLQSWSRCLESGEATGREVVRGFVFSKECTDKKLSNADFVEMLYQALFDRSADAEGAKSWSKALSKGMTREEICDGFIFSPEFAALCSKYGIEVGKKSSIDPNKPMVALTFDDGPGIYTSRLLDCLENNNAKATFFVVGTNAANYQSVMKRAFDLGCEIGNHTYNHPTLTRLSVADIQSQINRTNQYIKKATGSNATVMRPPGGAWNNTVKSAVGLPVILWSIDTRDWETRNAQSTINSVLKNVKDGDIVLMHDIHKQSVDAAEVIIPELVKRGYQLVTVSELAQYRGSGLSSGSVYYSFR